MRKNKGFTLIELLAVIAILGIIALITVPSVKKIMDDAKRKSFEDSAYGIIHAADLYYSRKDMLNEIEGDMTFTFPNVEELELTGKVPENGSMIIDKKGNIALAISNDDYCITKAYNDKDITVTEDYETCEIPVTTYALGDSVYFNPVTNKKCTDYVESNSTMGVKTGCMKWYIYKIDGNNLGLILDHNTTAMTAWITEEEYNEADQGVGNDANSYGPLYLNKVLKADTTDQGWKVSASILSIEEVLNLMPFYQKLDETGKENWMETYVNLITPALEDTETNVVAEDYATTKEYYQAQSNYIAENYSDIVLPSYMYADILPNNCADDGSCTTYGYWTSSPVAGSTSCASSVGFGVGSSSEFATTGCAQLFLSQNLPSNNSVI